MMSLQSYVNQSGHLLRKWSLDPRLRVWGKGAAYALAGFCLSAASLGHFAQPLCLGLVCSLHGWPAVLAALGGCIGYPVFWSSAGHQGLLWLFVGLLAALIDLRTLAPGLLPAVAGVTVALSGLVFQLFQIEQLPIASYFLRIFIAVGSTWVFSGALAGRDPLSKWLAIFGGTLALAQIAPVPMLCLGFPLAGALMVTAPFPAAALAGLALDLAQVTAVPMTAVVVLGYLLRFSPRYPKWLAFFGPGCVFITVMTLRGSLELYPLPGLMLGGLVSTWLPTENQRIIRRGPTGAAQVQLELAAGVFSQTQQLLLETRTAPVDEEALFTRAAEQACSGCANRKSCKDRRKLLGLPTSLLHQPLLSQEELPIICKKSGRLLAQLHRAQEQLRSIRADRQHQAEYRAALTQQYGFLSEYLQNLSDRLSQRESAIAPAYKPEILVFGNRPEPDNGDQCLRFQGSSGRYYVVLCDGMGTGPGAVQESRNAGIMLRKLLTAGFPPEHALQSLNSLCALGQRAGAVTVDLAELQLHTGRAVIYKWGAMPSYIVQKDSAQRIGAVSPPPGLSVTEHREQSHRISLKKGEMLVLISDGAHDRDTLKICTQQSEATPGDLGRRLMAHCKSTAEDDATVAIIRLLPQ